MKKNTVSYSSCKAYNTITTQPHQNTVIDFMMNTKQKGLIINHSTGSGKTITAIATARCLLANYPDKRVIILVPASVLEQFKNEVHKLIMIDLKNPALYSRFQVNSHVAYLNAFRNGRVDTTNAVLIVDEAHNFKTSFKVKSVSDIQKGGKTESSGSVEDDGEEDSLGLNLTYTPGRGVVFPLPGKKIDIQGIRAKLLQLAAQRAFKIILLSATPVVNSAFDLRNYIAMINNRSLEKEYKRFRSYMLKKRLLESDFTDYLRCAVSYYETPKDADDFPTVYQHHVTIRMDKRFEKKYEAVEQKELGRLTNKNTQLHRTANLRPFVNGLRRAINGLDNIGTKRTWLKKKIGEEMKAGRKSVIYSTFLEFGTKQIESVLNTLKVPYAVVDGSMSKGERKLIIDQYNANKLNTLVISAAGSEGLDLKETRNIIIMEPYWNPGRIKQVIGRGARKGSHKNLSPNDRNLHVWHLLLLKGNGDATADTLLFEMTNSKRDLIDTITDQMESVSIEKGDCH